MTDIVEQCIKGDRKAIETLYITYTPILIKFILRYVSDTSVAEDILHDGFIIIFSHLKSLKKPEKLEQWMKTIMKNLALAHTSQSDFHIALDDSIINNISDYSTQPYVEHEISYEELNKIIDSLPIGYKNVFRLAVLEHKSHIEIGKLLGISPNSSSSQLHRAKALLRRLITKRNMLIIGFALIPITITVLYIPSKKRQTIAFIPDNPHDLNVNLQASQTSSPLQKNLPPANPNKTDSCYADSHDIHTSDSVIIYPSQQANTSEVKRAALRQDVLSSYPHAQVRPKSKPTYSISISFGSNPITGNTVNSHDNQQNITTGIAPDAIIHHNNPYYLSLNISCNISRHIGITSGISYVYRSSDILRQNPYQTEKTTLQGQFVSLPIQLNYYFVNLQQLSFYTTAGMTVDIPISVSASDRTVYEDNSWTSSPIDYSIRPQVFMTGGVGFEYMFNSTLGIYLEPSIKYRLTSDPATNLLFEKNIELYIPLGLRLKF